MHKCIIATLATDAKLQLTSYQNDWTFYERVCAPLLYKQSHGSPSDSRATDLHLYDNPGVFDSQMVSCKYQFFDANYLAVAAKGKKVIDPTSLLFDGHFAAGDHLFIKYMKDK